jgi:CRP-like cAMP-binding protein
MANANERAWNPLVAKLSQFAPLSNKDIGVLETLCLPEERFGAGANIVVEGETPRSAFVITRGMACRYRLMADGRRQILTILIPRRFLRSTRVPAAGHGPLRRHHQPDADRLNRQRCRH